MPDDLNTSIIPYEDLSNTVASKQGIVGQALGILEQGWDRKGYKKIYLDRPVPWAMTSESERSWNFHLHCWDLLDRILKAYCLDKDTVFFKTALYVALDWVGRHDRENPADDCSPFAWYDMAVGLRAYRLAYILDAGRRENLLDADADAKLWVSLLQHQAYLADDANIAFHNNHGYYQVAGQAAMGRRFAEQSAEMAQAFRQGQERLLRMLEQQFAPDGVHREHSPDYHRMVYDTLKALIDAGLVSDPSTLSFAQKIEDALSWFILPNRHIANFGDSDYRSTARQTAEAARKWTMPSMQYMVSDGKIGALPPEHFKIFRDSGYFIVRKPPAGGPRRLDQSSYLAQTAAFHSRTHKHADDLSFIWYDHGQDILVDAGRYGYIGKTAQGSDLWKDGFWYADPNRVYCESTRAHNTLEFNGLNLPRKGVPFYGSAVRRSVEHGSGLIVMETECKYFKSVLHTRVLAYMPGRWLLVFDWFHDNNRQAQDVRQWFHFAPQLRVSADGGGYTAPLESPDAGLSLAPLRVRSLIDGPKASRLYIGETGEAMQGWWSPTERNILPNYAVGFDLGGKETGAFATLFDFTERLETEHDWSQVNVSGRKARFRWTDDEGRHTLSLERPAAGDMELDYTCKAR